MSSFATNPLKQIVDAQRNDGSGRFRPLGANIKVLMVWPRFPPSFWGFGSVGDAARTGGDPPLGLVRGLGAVAPDVGSAAAGSGLRTLQQGYL